MKYLKIIISLSLAVLMFSGFWDGKSDKQLKKEAKKERFLERNKRLKVNNETLQMLFKEVPEARKALLKSYGYATFSNVGATVILFSYEGGDGVAHNNRNGQNTYMKMNSAGIGLGLGGKNFRSVFFFKNKKVYKEFIDSGWEANAQADAAASYDESGGSSGGAVTVKDGVLLYKLTQDGLLVQATLQGTKYYKDEDLNGY